MATNNVPIALIDAIENLETLRGLLTGIDMAAADIDGPRDREAIKAMTNVADGVVEMIFGHLEDLRQKLAGPETGRREVQTVQSEPIESERDSDRTTLDFDPSKLPELDSMEFDDLGSLRGALRTLGDVVSGMVSQPAFCASRNELGAVAYTNGGARLYDIMEWLSRYETAVRDAAALTVPLNKYQREERAWLLLDYDADNRDNLQMFAHKAMALASECGNGNA